MKNYTISLVLNLLTWFLITSCTPEQDYFPERNPDMPLSYYDDFAQKLKEAYANHDQFSIAFQLANLKAPATKVFDAMQDAILSKPENCNKIYRFYRSAYFDGFYMNIVKLDTLNFKKMFVLCLDINGPDSYKKYHEEILQEEKVRALEQLEIDTSGFNTYLRNALRGIANSDQQHRRTLADFRTKVEARDSLLVLQNRLDSLNLIKIDAILSNYGYPTSSEVGRDLQSTIWLVLQHQKDIEIRNKYYSFLEANVSESQLTIFNKRTESLK